LLPAPPEVGHIAFEKSSFDGAVARRAKVQLDREALKPIVFQEDTPAIYLCALPGPFVGVTAGQTLIVSVQGAAKTITIAAVAGKHVSDAAHFKIAVDSDAVAWLDTGTKIALTLETTVRSLGRAYALVTEVFTIVYR